MNVTCTDVDADASRRDPFYYEGDLPKDTQSCAVNGGLPVKTVIGHVVIANAGLSFEFDARNASSLIWVSGRLVPRAEATVSVHR